MNIKVSPSEIETAQAYVQVKKRKVTRKELSAHMKCTDRRARTILEYLSKPEPAVDVVVDHCSLPKTPKAKAWAKREVEIASVKLEVEAIKAELKKGLKPATVYKSKKKSGYVAEFMLADVHVGKLAWKLETLSDNYDTNISTAIVEEAVETLIQRLPTDIEYDEIVLPLGNDLLHTDNTAQTTTAGTQMDVDGRFHKTFLVVRKLMTRIIVRLREIAPVKVIMVPGNHDELSVWHLGDSLECLFANDPEVTVVNDPAKRKYYEHGKVMLMFTHGNTGKLADYPITMATEQPEMFGRTKFREVHTGDKHQEALQEIHGVKVRIFGALSATDAWHSNQFYTGMQRTATAMVFHKDEGLVSTAVYTVKEDGQYE